MKLLLNIILMLFMPHAALANNSFADYFEYESSLIPEHADEITQHFTENSLLNTKKRINNFVKYNDHLNKQIKGNPDKAILWFTKGLNFKNRLLALEQQKLTDSSNIQPQIKQTVEYMKKSFIKAMQLDQVKKQKLTSKMYGTMKHSLESDSRITALKNELALGGSGDNESQYWFSHWDIIGSLQDEGRLDEAEEALYNMQKELKSAGLEEGKFKQIYQKAKTNLAKDHSLSSDKEKTIVSQVIPKTPDKKSKKESLFDNIKSKFGSYWFMVLLNIIVVISLIIAFVKREKD